MGENMATPDDCPILDKDERMLRAALVGAAADVLDDRDRMRKFWRGGWEAFAEHTSDGTKKWIGSKIMASIGAALLGAGLYLIGRFSK